VLLQDFTGVPAVVDLAAMRDAMQRMGGDPSRINPLQPAELVIDHSVQVDEFGTRLAFEHNVAREYERNQERYAFLRWGQKALRNFRVVPPGTGIVHQVNLEYLARVVFHTEGDSPQAYPDTLVGTDSHTTMVNGLGVLGWGVGGIEAEAAMLGQPVSMLIPQVVGLPAGRRDAGGRHGHGPGADGDGDAARPRGGGQVRGVLRPGPGFAAAGRPCDDRQHGAGVRRHVRHLPGGREDAPVPRVHRPGAGARGTGARVHEGTGHVPYGGHAGGRVLGHHGTGPGHGGAVAGRPAPAAGPDPAVSGEDVVLRVHGGTAAEAAAPSKPRAEIKQWETEGGEVAVRPQLHTAQCTLDGQDIELHDGAWSLPPSPAARTRRTPPS
jgi:hypothetical protein